MNFLPEAEFGDEFHPFVTSDKYLGSLTKLLRAQSLLPRGIEGQAILEKAVRLDPGVISRPQKQRILLCIAAGRRDIYCAGLARDALRLLGEPDRRIDGLVDDYSRVDLPAAEEALLDFCVKSALDSLSVSSSDIDKLREQGFDDEVIIEAAASPALEQAGEGQRIDGERGATYRGGIIGWTGRQRPLTLPLASGGQGWDR